MKKGPLLLAGFWMLVTASASAETATGKTDVVSDMQKTFNPREQAKDIERIKQLQDVTGQEWLELSLGERMDHMLAALYVLKAHGVEPRKSLNDYCNAVERALVLNSGWIENQLTDILAQVIHDKEPGARTALDSFMKERRGPQL